ncbi:ABC transporter ATP-binding protein [Clostridium oryzae]|uniref:Putative HMP/thiamine import ATP-binding protein YkoD n=1 Tax=Clostridium oryzae TaxID=1450648 RepID=A0A1V4I659_9CLOT|nr:ABC transporter ATP-binding protein [Clostridium oryzae]OPJ55360.1 putative HMP/thiamine import ATP-binding protein YkoD [Clostridium oryzae]
MGTVVFKDFSFKYSNLKEPTLKNINIVINSGEKVLIAGPSGSGKSTLAHCINGLIPFRYKGDIKGTVKVDDVIPQKDGIYKVSEHVGTILQDQDAQFVGLSVGEDVAFIYENNNVVQQEMFRGVDSALEQVNMLNFIKHTPQNLSGGQKQKVAIAGMLASDAPILLFDEPLANLDPASGKKAMEIINEIHKETKKTVIIIEHRIEDVLEHDFNRIIIMNNGEVAADGSPDDILSSNILPDYGLREPLYVEALKKINISILPENKISHIENSIRYKEEVLSAYKNRNIYVKNENKNKMLSIENLSFRYFKDDKYLLNDISFSINEGEILAVLGNNGAGKSTLMKIITGMQKQDKGSIRYQDKSIDKWSIKKRAEIIGYVMQNPNHMITQNMIFDEVAFGMRNFGIPEEEVKRRVEDTLKICGLHKYRKWPVSSLSYGQRKRVTIASILCMHPKILILDEPTAGQDYRNYKEFMTFVDKIKLTGVSIVMITHDMHLALEYADRAVVMSKGKVIAEDSVFNILSNKPILKQADLKSTSISSLAELYGLDSPENFLAYFVNEIKGGESND